MTRNFTAKGLLGAVGAAMLAGCMAASTDADDRAPGDAAAAPRVDVLLSTGETVLGQELRYPDDGPPHVSAAIVTLAPGQRTGWHEHAVPLFGYVLEGELSVDYGRRGRRVYRAGDSLMEAVDWPHNGVNTGAGAVRILAVYAGADGVPNSTPAPAPDSAN